MRYYIRLFALIILFTQAVLPVKAATLFPDISESDPDYASIQYVYSHHIMTGSEDGQFHPNLPLTRCELAKIAVIGSEFLPLTGDHEQDFSDLPLANWCDADAHLLKSRNIISGYPDGTFRPNQKVSQIEALKILFNSRYISMNVWSVTSDLYSDVHANDWWAPYISLAQGREITNHRSGDKYGIQEPMTRKEAAHILWRLSTLFPVINETGMGA